ncbi:MAG: sigma-70 family RNA polymerase sigma factor, partial [Prevotellaceae bacterium]|nr:sigma-70 family RNA polymerase sigma factor [Prevotellaceae bacterium]
MKRKKANYDTQNSCFEEDEDAVLSKIYKEKHCKSSFYYSYFRRTKTLLYGRSALLSPPKSTSASPQSLSDGALVAQFAGGKQSAFEELLARYHDRIYLSILDLVESVDEANEVMQEVLIKMMVALQKGNYKDRGKFLGWSLSVVYNHTGNYHQHRHSLEREVLGLLSKEFPITGCAFSDLNAEERMVVTEEYRELHRLLRHLPVALCESVKLRYFDGY